MVSNFYLFLIVLALVAVFLQADFVLTLIYLYLGVITLGRWWSRRALHSVVVRRQFPSHVFWGEKLSVQLDVHNRGLLPVVWLQLRESHPVELVVQEPFRRVISLGGKSHAAFEYPLEARRRGLYTIGPLLLYSGDLFGLAEQEKALCEADSLTVYPRIIPLTKVKLPSHSPLGTLRHTQPVYEDPTRVMGKREYVAGDSQRRIDWKSTATTGRLQVKIYEPSIALETAIFLNLNSAEYESKARYDATELAITTAASLASWVVGARQSVGLATNGVDPLLENSSPPAIPVRRGRAHLMRILETLARIQAADTTPLAGLLQRETVRLAWGTSLIVITPFIDETLFDALFQARRAGLPTILIACGPVAHSAEKRRQAEYFGFPFQQLLNENDLDIWRQ